MSVDPDVEASHNAIADLHSTLPPTASFSPEVAPMPEAVLTGQTLPRQLEQRHYTGVGRWNSRNLNLMTALRAMLGDPHAYAESPEFTLRKLQLRYADSNEAFAAALNDAVYHSSQGKSWGGYNRFFDKRLRQVNAHAELDALEQRSPAATRSLLQRVRRAAPTTDSAAAELARVLVDQFFADPRSRKHWLHRLVEYADTSMQPMLSDRTHV